MIANEGFVSLLDITKYPPLIKDFKETGVPVPDNLLFPGSFGNNSICANNPSATVASLGMSFLAMDQETVTAKTISYSGAMGGFALAGLWASILLAF